MIGVFLRFTGLFLCLLYSSGCFTASESLVSKIDYGKIHNHEYTYEERRAFNEPIRHPFLWEVSRNGRTSYLFGSFHAGISVDQLPINVLRIFNQSKLLVTEVDLDDPGAGDLYEMPESPDSNAPRGKIKQNISAKAWQILSNEAMFKDEYLDNRTPAEAYFLYQISKVIVPTMERGSLDNEFFRRAKKSGMQRGYLETPAEREEVIKGLKPADIFSVQTYQELEKALIEGDKITFLDILKAYKSGELPKMQRFIAEIDVGSDALIDKRNLLWQPRIVKMVEQGGAFIVFGVGHVSGEQNILKLLEQSGCSVKRLHEPTR